MCCSKEMFPATELRENLLIFDIIRAKKQDTEFTLLVLKCVAVIKICHVLSTSLSISILKDRERSKVKCQFRGFLLRICCLNFNEGVININGY